MNATTKQLILVALGALAFAATIEAQDSTSAQAATAYQPNCDRRLPSGGGYIKCGLILEKTRLRRGASGEEMAKAGFLVPIRLTDYVRGDSAQRYARHYESSMWITGVMKSIGIGLYGVAVGVASSKGCTWPFCRSGPRANTAKTIALVGVSFSILSLPFRDGAMRAGTRAVWWNNAGLGR